MEQKGNYRKQVQDFTSIMYQKGYRGRFHLMRAGTPQMTGSLHSLLETQLNDYFSSAGERPMFELKTFADLADKIECTFKMLITERKGFQVQQLEVHDMRSDQRKRYSRLDNNQIPGSVAVQSLFPRPKPWDGYLKGKFRP